jgi:hypothetical protein
MTSEEEYGKLSGSSPAVIADIDPGEHNLEQGVALRSGDDSTAPIRHPHGRGVSAAKQKLVFDDIFLPPSHWRLYIIK